MGTVGRVDDPARWRTPAVVAGSLVIHPALLGPLALRGLGLAEASWPDIPEPPFFIPVDIEPRPILPGERPRVGLPPGRAETPIQSRTLARPAEAVAATRSDLAIDDDEEEQSADQVRPLQQSDPDWPSPSATELWPATPRDADLAARIGASLARGTGSCRTLSARATPEQRAACDQAFADVEVARITGTDDPRRDARFAALGDQALAEYDARRAALKPHSRANPCPHMTDIMGRCPVQVMVPLWSSNDGFLPGLKRD